MFVFFALPEGRARFAAHFWDPRGGRSTTQIGPGEPCVPSGFAFFRMQFFEDVEVHVFNLHVCFFALPDGTARFGARFGGSKTVLGSSWFGPCFVLRLGIAFCTVLGPSCGRFGALLASFWTILGSLGPVLGRLGLSWGRFCTLWMAFGVPIILTSLQLIDVSSLQPTALRHFTSRPGGLREAIK